MTALDELALRYGIAVRHTGLDGAAHDVPDETKRTILAAMGVAADSEEAVAASLSQAPERAEGDATGEHRCFVPDWLEHGRAWGISVQLYALRSARNWGIGDFADLSEMARIAAAAGADFLGVNPLHAGFLADPERRSPFSPSHRRFLNPLYIAPDRIPGYKPEMADEGGLAAARAGELVDHSLVAATKLQALLALFGAWRLSSDLPDPYSHQAFSDFVAQEGEPLRRHALFETLSAAMVAAGHGAGWDSWPEAFASPEAPEVERFARVQASEVEFHLWLQWVAAVQLADANRVARERGMRIGLYLDLAVGEAPDGSATWGEPELTMRGVHVGAPPDYFSANGQDWQLAPLSPTALLRQDGAAYRGLIAGNMRFGGALRIDHAMAVKQLFLVPKGRSPAEGAYLRYPTAALLAALAAASHEYKAVVIGEDLGNVPVGFRDFMAAARMMSYRILYFERWEHGFISPADYPRDALACLSTHDLPTLEGWWRGDDIRLRREHDLIDQPSAETQHQHRRHERRQLGEMMVQLGLLSTDEAARALAAAESAASELPTELLIAAHRLIARTPCRITAARIEDLVGQREPVNLPGTVDSYPNWKRKLPLSLEQIGDSARFRAVAAALAEERPR